MTDPMTNMFEFNGEMYTFYKKIPGRKICAFSKNGSV